MGKGRTALQWASLGASLVFFLDPARGRRRRSALIGKALHLERDVARFLDAAGRDAGHRLEGLLASAGAVLHGREAVPDYILEQRVRSKLGRLVSHPGQILVAVSDGAVHLAGPIPPAEKPLLTRGVAKVAGVRFVSESLQDVPEPGGDPLAQRHHPALLRTTWTPTARLALGGAGAFLTLAGAHRPRGIRRLGLEAGGLALLARAVANVPLKRLLGVGVGPRAVDVQKAATIKAPLDKVFGHWRDLTNFPRFMARVKLVEDLGAGRFRWVVQGPAGVPVSWDAVVTKLIPNELIAWKSVPGSLVESAGTVSFRGNDDGSTRLLVRLSYNPPAGALGHGLARLLGGDPKRLMDEDLVRLKAYFETGHPPRDAAQK